MQQEPRRPPTDHVRVVRERIRSRRTPRLVYRFVVALLGVAITLGGLLLVPLPGPGWLIVFAGLFVLASEFTWAEQLLEYTKRQVTRWTDWVGAQPVWVRVLIGLATAAFVYGVVVLTLHVLGVPDWVPGWVPLWR